MACVICLDDKSDLVEWECGLGACRDCSLSWIESKIKDHQLPSCIKGCDNHVVSREFVCKLISEDDTLYQKYDYIFTEMSIPAADRVYCHKCTFPLKRENGDSCKCHICSELTCCACKGEYLAKHICPGETEVATKEAIKKFGYQTCTCGFTIEKIEFCDKISCKCGRVFCYVCNSDYRFTPKGYKKVCECDDFSQEEEFFKNVTYVAQIVMDTNIFAKDNSKFIQSTRQTWFEKQTSLYDYMHTYKQKVSERTRIGLRELEGNIISALTNMVLVEVSNILVLNIKSIGANNFEKLKLIDKFIYENRTSETLALRQQLANAQIQMNQMKRKLDDYEENERKRPHVTTVYVPIFIQPPMPPKI